MTRSSSGGCLVAIIAFVVLGLLFASCQVTRGVPAVGVELTFPSSTVVGQAPVIPFPTAGASIVAVDGLGTLGSAGQTTPRPIASVTKIMTAYVILKGHPLQQGQGGPTVTISIRDANRYIELILADATALFVQSGTALSEYELLQGALIASANNFAEYLATWDAGSVPNFVAKMNAEAKALGLNNTTYADPHGLSPGSVSTPQDQLILARAAMENPVFREIVGMKTARITGVGPITAVNELLGQEGVIGIKTGFTEEAGGNLVYAAKRQVAGQDVEITGAVLGQTTRPIAFEASRRVIVAVANGLQQAKVVAAGQVVGAMTPAWGNAVEIMVAEDVNMLLWPGMTVSTVIQIDVLDAPVAAGARVGWMDVTLGEQQKRVPLVLAKELPDAGIAWRLLHF